MKNRKPADLCPAPSRLPQITTTEPKSPPIYMSSVYKCRTTNEAQAMLAGEEEGFVYLRDGHPNGELLAARCRELHGADQATIVATGMAALALAMVSQLRAGDHVILSRHLYGRTTVLFQQEAERLGIICTLADCTDSDEVATAFQDNTKLLVVESLANPCLQLVDLPQLADLSHQHEARLLVDNTIASPIHCRPLQWGADLVVESMTKIMNGHSDVILGLLAGRDAAWERVMTAQSSWGWTASPMDCWLAQRGLATLDVRAERASSNASAIAQFLFQHPQVAHVDYPGLESHPQHQLAQKLLTNGFGHIVTFRLHPGANPNDILLATSESIPFCPSLGEFTTTFSHPASTSHFRLSLTENAQQGIFPETLRLSVGIESCEHLIEVLGTALQT